MVLALDAVMLAGEGLWQCLEELPFPSCSLSTSGLGAVCSTGSTLKMGGTTCSTRLPCLIDVSALCLASREQKRGCSRWRKG